MALQSVTSVDYGVPADVERWMRLLRKVSAAFPGPETEKAMNGALY